MNWDRVDETVRAAYRKNGHDMYRPNGRTPLSDLVGKDPIPDIDEMTAIMLRDFATENHIAIGEGLTREEMIEAIKDALEKNWDERVHGMIRMIDYFFEDGPHPLAVIRRVLAVAKAIRPEAIHNMSLAQIAVLSDDGKGRTCDGRATVSERIKRLFEEPIRKSGMRGFKTGFQKTDSANHNYSVAGQGNQNRLGKDFLELNGHQKKRKAA
jgi:hypothetical protein